MKYSFKDITNNDIYKETRVMFVTGPYNLFNNIVVDELKSRCKGSGIDQLDLGLVEEFGIDIEEQIQVSNAVDFDTFTKVIKMPSVNGKWFTTCDLGVLSKKNTEWLKEYIKSPSDNGIIVLTSNEYKHYKYWLTNRQIASDKYVSLIQLSFPNKDALREIVIRLFAKRNARIEQRALDLFIVRMSNAYDQYENVIENICAKSLPNGYMQMSILETPVITYTQAFECLRGIENFVIDDFLERLTVPLNSDNPSSRIIVFKMMSYLVEEYGARKLVNILLKKIDELIEFRIAINDGYIPIIVNYNVDEAKRMLGEDSQIATKSDFQFRKLAKLASMTSLKDWIYMKMILQNTSKFDDNSYDKVLYSLINRSVLTESRLNNDIGVEDLNNYDMQFIDNIAYQDCVETQN